MAPAKNLYVRPGDEPIWEAAEAAANERRQSVSELVTGVMGDYLTKGNSPADVSAIVRAAVAEAVMPLRAELVLVKDALVRASQPQTAAARAEDAALLRDLASDYLAKAAEVSRKDPILAAGYESRAKDLLTKAESQKDRR